MDVGIAPFTMDADLALAPEDLADEPLVEDLMRSGGFTQEGSQPGSWTKRIVVDGKQLNIPVDIMVAAGHVPAGGRRGARIDPHDRMAARKALGLEGAVIDNERMEVTALDSDDGRSFSVRVAGPAALLVSKLHKVHERVQSGNAARILDKDAADIYRIMRAVAADTVVERLNDLLNDEKSRVPTEQALQFLNTLFGARRGRGTQMAVIALRTAVPPETVETVCTNFVRTVLNGLPHE